MPATINDIAREAGVSIATVSKVINNKAHVAPDTREKVLQVMDKLNYASCAQPRGGQPGPALQQKCAVCRPFLQGAAL